MQSDEFRRALEAIKLRAPIEDVVRERVPSLKKSGALWKACCPFHDERTPSFTVDPRRGTWHCFGACSTGGDQIRFIERFDNIGFMDAVEILAARTGVELPKRNQFDRAQASSDEALLGPLEHAARFYRDQLRTSEGQAAVRYMRERGLSDVTSEAFGVGYSPSSGAAFVNEARNARLDLEACEKAGLVRRNDAGRPYDFFRGRLMIPIKDPKGRTVGFGARRLVDGDEAGPKYMNSQETDVFHKGRLVYALDRALPEVRKNGRIVLVEGYTDVMAAHQCGVSTVVAVLGTATTEDHAALIRKTGARRVSLVFDGDDAGRKAAYRALHGLLTLEVELDVVSLTGGIDPCDLCVRDGSAGFLAQLEMAQNWFDFLVDGLRGKSGVELSREVDRVLELFARLSKPVHRDSRIVELAKALDLPVRSVREQFAQLSLPRRRPTDTGAARTDTAGVVVRETPAPVAMDKQVVRAFEEMLGFVLVDAGTFPLMRPFLDRCPDPELTRIFAAITALYDDMDASIDESSVLNQLGDDDARLRVVPIATRARSVDEDYTPKRMVESQIAMLERRAREIRTREDCRTLGQREAQVLREAGAESAVKDSVSLEIARQMAASSRSTRTPITSTPTHVQD